MQFELNGDQVEVADDGATLLDVLRDQLGVSSVKDGCSPQGQCGCCTVLVDGEPRVSCVTPARRVADRRVETVEGLPSDVASAWAESFCAVGASQCGFCTPGIVMRLEGARRKGNDLTDRAAVDRSLAAHLCRCTGWQTIVEAAASFGDHVSGDAAARDLEAASRRATVEGGTVQRVGTDVVLGRGGFADDGAPAGTVVAVSDPEGTWVSAPSLSEARRAVGKVQGRRTTVEAKSPVALPEGDWAHTLQTGWVDPAYLETDASWCEPGGTPSDPLANGGAFGAKTESPVPAAARELADRLGTPVRLRWSREDTLRRGPKRPPMAIGVAADGTGVVRVARTAGITAAIDHYLAHSAAVGWRVEEVDIAGPPTTAGARAAGWGEVAAVRAALAAAPDGAAEVTTPDGAWAAVRVTDDGIDVRVRCGDVLDAVVLRSYCIGAVHMALGWVRSEGLAVDGEGEVLSLTIRSLGIVRPGDMPPVSVEIVDDAGVEPVSGSDAVFVATAAAVWRHLGLPPTWPADS